MINLSHEKTQLVARMPYLLCNLDYTANHLCYFNEVLSVSHKTLWRHLNPRELAWTCLQLVWKEKEKNTNNSSESVRKRVSPVKICKSHPSLMDAYPFKHCGPPPLLWGTSNSNFIIIQCVSHTTSNCMPKWAMSSKHSDKLSKKKSYQLWRTLGQNQT